MIAFASLFLGLIVGIQPVSLLVGDSVASVELLLDGRTIGSLEGGDWSLPCDFGKELVPHELVAIGYNGDHKEVARARQLVNLSRRPAETAVVLNGGKDGEGVKARLSWNSVVGAEPVSITVSFDGQTLDVADPFSIPLPDFDPKALHFLRAELDFSSTVSSVAEITFGGSYTDRINTELTAVPIMLEETGELPAPRDLRGVFRKQDQALTVVASEKGFAEVIIVRDERARRGLGQLGRTSRRELKKRARYGISGDITRNSLRMRMALQQDLRVRFLWPFSQLQERDHFSIDVFSPSQEFTAEDGGFYWLLTRTTPPSRDLEKQRLSDAVAAAGMLVARRNRRRAVLLLLGDKLGDSSQFRPSQVTGYLRSLRVPLFVWSTEGGNDLLSSTWGAVTEISSMRDLERAISQLYRELDRQRMVWLDGVHLPQEIELASAELGFSLVR